MRSAEGLLLTEAGWQKLYAELWALEAEKVSGTRDLRDAVAASGPGDDDFGLIVELGAIDRRIAELKQILSSSIAIGEADREPDVVGVGSTVSVRWEDGEAETYVIVGPPEVDSLTGRISYESPVGRALLGRRSGEKVEISTPSGSTSLLVLTVE